MLCFGLDLIRHLGISPDLLWNLAARQIKRFFPNSTAGWWNKWVNIYLCQRLRHSWCLTALLGFISLVGNKTDFKNKCWKWAKERMIKFWCWPTLKRFDLWFPKELQSWRNNVLNCVLLPPHTVYIYIAAWLSTLRVLCKDNSWFRRCF